MKLKLFAVVTVWALSLIGVAVWAQGNAPMRPGPNDVNGRQVREGEPVGDVITGADIGFQRVASMQVSPGTVSGKLMVRVNGLWLEARPAMFMGRVR